MAKDSKTLKQFKFTEAQETWLQALESGEFKQGRSHLHQIDSKTKKETYCCLGVACKLLGPKANKPERWTNSFDTVSYGPGKNAADLPPSLVKKLKMRGPDGQIWGEGPEVTDQDKTTYLAKTLVSLNDSARWSFKKIAKWIRKNPEQIFTNNDPKD